MPDYIGPALRGLSQTLQTGLADMGKSRLQEAELALKGAEIGHKIRLEQQEAPKRALELLTARKRAMEEIDKDKPFNVSGFVENDLVPVQLTGGQVSPRLKTNVKMFGAQIVPKLGKAFGEDTEYDPVNKLWYHKSTNTPVTKREVEERQQALSGLIMMHTDGGKFLEMLAEEGSPAAIQTMQGRQADPLAYQKQVLDIKRQVYEQLASQNLGEKALKPALDRLLKEEERYEKLLLEQRTEGRAQLGPLEIAKEGGPLKLGTVYQTNKRGKVEVVQKPKEDDYSENLLVAAQAVGIDPGKVKTGKLTTEEANRVADEYSKKFGTQNFLKMLLDASSSGVGGGGGKTLKFDSKGNPIQ